MAPSLVVKWQDAITRRLWNGPGGVGMAPDTVASDTVAGDPSAAEFGILGPLRVSIAGRALALGGPRQRAVLALLLLEANRFVSMDLLAEDVWAGQPPPGWVATLQTYIVHLRRALEPQRAASIA